MSSEIWIGLGSNLGDRFGHLQFAIRRLTELGVLRQLSDVYETEPWGRKEQPYFLNAVVSLEAHLPDPLLFLTRLQQIEREAGRQAGERWSPRPLDLDLLFWGKTRISTEQLVVPHPYLTERKFILIPLVQVAPHLVHPVNGCTMQELLAQCADPGTVQPWGTFAPTASYSPQ